MKKNSLSVTICNYNHGKYISNAVSAMLNQSVKPDEIIILDDASTDNSLAVIRDLKKKHPSIKLLINDENKGVVYSANRCLSIASGEFVYSASADDQVLPGFFEKSLKLLQAYPDAGLCCSIPLFFLDKGKASYVADPGISEKPLYLAPQQIVGKLKSKYFCIAGNTSVIRKQMLIDAGAFIPELRWHSDWFFLHVIGFRNGMCYIPEALASFRMVPKSYSSGKRNRKEQNKIVNAMLDVLKTKEYSDVVESFRESGILAIFGIDLLTLILRNDALREFYTPRLIKYVIKDLMKMVVPSRLNQLLNIINIRRKRVYKNPVSCL